MLVYSYIKEEAISVVEEEGKEKGSEEGEGGARCSLKLPERRWGSITSVIF